MRTSSLLLLCSLALLLCGCRQHQTSQPVAESGTSAASIPVGPIPGGVQQSRYASNPLTNNPVALQDGRRLFNWYNCSGCHGGHAGGGMGPSLRDQVWLYGDRDDQIFDSIAQGRGNGMPAWGSKIPEMQIWELVAYIKSMRSPQEPDPPVEPTDEMTPNPVQDTQLGIGTQSSTTSITETSGSSENPNHPEPYITKKVKK